VIPLDFVTEWRGVAPWAQDAQVEQDLILTRALAEVFRKPEAARALAFRGGTALYKLHLAPAARYSEDIDLVQVAPGPIGAVLDALRAVLDPWLGEPRRKLGEGRVTLVYRMRSEGMGLPLRLKIEINSREHFSVLGLEERPLVVDSRWFRASVGITTYALDELLGTKLLALYQRKRGRDLFDLGFARKRGSVDPARLVRCLLGYLDAEGKRIAREDFETNLADKLADPTFADDVRPLLASGVEWDAAAAGDFVFRELLPLLPGRGA